MPRTFEDSNKAGSFRGHKDIYDEHCMDVLKVKYFLNVKSFFHLVNFSISHALFNNFFFLCFNITGL